MASLSELIFEARKLTPKEKQILINGILNQTIDYISLKNVQIDNIGITCPHCESKKIIRHGKLKLHNNTNRFYCKACNKTFTAFTGTSIHGIHNKSKWVSYIEMLVDGVSIRKTAEKLDISTKTAFNWRHKILSALTNKISFNGIVESDETYFRESQKGSRNMTRPPRKRGLGDGKISRGISKDKVAVVVSADRNGNIDMVKSNLGRPKIDHLKEVFKGKLSSDSILCTDSHHTYKGFANLIKVEFKMVNASRKQYVNQKIYHIQHVNSLHGKLKHWANHHFKGVSTKYLHNYLAWMVFMEKIKTSSNKTERFFDEVLMSNSTKKIYLNIQNEYLKFVA